MCVNLQVKSSKDSQRIYSQDSLQSTVEKNTPYSDRITVNTTAREVVLTIRDVQLKDDEVAFNCFVKIIGEGSGEGGTKLKVFSKIYRILMAERLKTARDGFALSSQLLPVFLLFTLSLFRFRNTRGPHNSRCGTRNISQQ